MQGTLSPKTLDVALWLFLTTEKEREVQEVWKVDNSTADE
jgi:hypothetical protein